MRGGVIPHHSLLQIGHELLKNTCESEMFSWLKRREPVAKDSSDTLKAVDPEVLRTQGDTFLHEHHLEAAAKCYLLVLKSQPHDTKALTSIGFVRLQQGLAVEAVAYLSQAVAMESAGHDAYYMLGTLHEVAGELSLAIDHLLKAVTLEPTFDLARRDLSRVLFKAGKSAEAKSTLESGIAQNASFADYHFYLGNLQLAEGEATNAAASYAKAVENEPNHASAQVNLGIALSQAGDWDGATAALQKALVLDPTNALIHGQLGNVYFQLGQVESAIASLRASVAADPTDASTLSSLGHVLRVNGKPEQAVEACRLALAINPSLAEAHNNLGNALNDLARSAEALTCYERAIDSKPDFADALVNLAQVLSSLRRPQEALKALERALTINDRATGLYGIWLHLRMRVCDWRDIEAAFAQLRERIDRGDHAIAPWIALAAPLSAWQQKICASTFVQQMGFPAEAPLQAHSPNQRIRLGYFSADLHNHATAYLMAELFERHDRTRFEVIAFSFGPRAQDAMRARLEAAFDHFLDVASLTDAEIAHRSREMQIDIAVDLKGFTEDCRPGIFAYRAAPIQVSYMGFPGTMGTPFMDYLLADSTVIPLGDAGAYTEKVAFLPNSYQANDSKRRISEDVFTRADTGLPASGFVFCCFNNNYKITPDVFDVWMRLLHALPGSVLWLLQDSVDASTNLSREAQARGIAPDRLIFAPRVEMPKHLARQRLADLFLDTLYCNAHTTASDALWAGLPVLTCMGKTFASRVAGSLLRAAGLAELVVETLADYEQLAMELATDTERLKAVRKRLADNRLSCPLFDSALLTRNVEAAYAAMWQRQLEGLAPDHVNSSGANEEGGGRKILR